jgi:hypothetical protein
MKKSILLVLAALALMVSSAFAQNGAFAPYVDAGIGASSTFNGSGTVTAHNPNYIVGAGIESSTKHLLLNLDANFQSADFRAFGKVNSNAFAATVTGTGYLKFGKLLVGTGAFYKDQVINGNYRSLIPNLQTTTFAPLVGGGFQFSRDRITALYELPGRSATNQRTVDLNNEIYLTKTGHLRLTQQLSLNSSIASLPAIGSARISGGNGSVGLKLVF